MTTAPPGARLPQFLIIGAPKSGTTWMTRRLASHPAIFMPPGEIQFFTKEWERGWDWYLDLFAAAGPTQMLGENSNTYLTDPAAAARLAAELPEAKLLCSLRHPVDRAYSSYGMQVDRGRANGDIDRYMDPARSPRPHILSNGLYARMLRPFYETFGRDRILVTLFDEVQGDPKGVYDSMLAHLGLPQDFTPEGLGERENVRKAQDVPGGVKRALWWLRPYLEREPLASVARGPLGQSVRRLLTRPKRYPAMSPELSRRLADYYAPSIEELEQLLDRPLDAWRGKYAAASR